MYVFLAGAALWLFAKGVGESNVGFISFSALLSAITMISSFDLTYITQNGDVVRIEGGEYLLAFVWFGLLVLNILSLMLAHLEKVREVA